jgi:hypothetical protein
LIVIPDTPLDDPLPELLDDELLLDEEDEELEEDELDDDEEQQPFPSASTSQHPLSA